jgi:hypothetical protein
MRFNRLCIGLVAVLLQIAITGTHQIEAQPGADTANLDARVRSFLDGARYVEGMERPVRGRADPS